MSIQFAMDLDDARALELAIGFLIGPGPGAVAGWLLWTPERRSRWVPLLLWILGVPGLIILVLLLFGVVHL